MLVGSLPELQLRCSCRRVGCSNALLVSGDKPHRNQAVSSVIQVFSSRTILDNVLIQDRYYDYHTYGIHDKYWPSDEHLCNLQSCFRVYRSFAVYFSVNTFFSFLVCYCATQLHLHRLLLQPLET